MHRLLLIGGMISAVALGSGCKRSDTTGGAGGDTGAGGSGAGGGSSASTASIDSAVVATLATQQTLALADTFFNFDPDLDPKASANQNLQKIRDNASTQGGTCAKVSLGVGGLTVDFGSGCTLKNGMIVSGSVTAKVTKGAGKASLTVALGFDTFVLNGFDLDGSTSLETSNGSDFDVTLDVTHAGSMVKATLQVAGSPGSISIDGSTSRSRSGATTAATLDAVEMKAGDCYPDGGSMSVSEGSVKSTVTFSASTATTGQATITVGKASSCLALPAYGSCMPTACTGS